MTAIIRTMSSEAMRRRWNSPVNYLHYYINDLKNADMALLMK